MQVKLYNQEAQETGTIDLPNAIFGVKWNKALVKQVVESERANRRQTIAHTKIRQEVRGGGKKPWKQKGTGRARAGSSRSPLWKGGGTTFGPRNTTVFKKRIGKMMRRKALFTVLSAKVKDNECFFVDQFALANPKTKEFAAIIKKFPNVFGKSIAVVSRPDVTVERAARNIARVDVMRAGDLNALDIMQKKFLFISKDAIALIEKTFLKR